ncbi:hypothetical protein V6N13_071906 [Hibiscus sabdariffa]
MSTYHTPKLESLLVLKQLKYHLNLEVTNVGITLSLASSIALTNLASMLLVFKLQGSTALAGLCSGSSSYGLEGMFLPKLLPALALPFLCAGKSGIGRSAMAEVAGVGAAERIGTASAGLEGVGPFGCRWSRGDCQSNTSFSSSDEKCTSSVVLALAEVLVDG